MDLYGQQKVKHSMARGVYWRDQGKAPVELGFIKKEHLTVLYLAASISRGYKSGYNIIQTGGSRGSSDGGGGNGDDWWKWWSFGGGMVDQVS